MKTADLSLKVLKVIVWLVFIALCIRAGAILFGAILSAGKNGRIYKDYQLNSMWQYSTYCYTVSVSFMVLAEALKAYIAYLLVRLICYVQPSELLSKPVMLIINIINKAMLLITAAVFSHVVVVHWVQKQAVAAASFYSLEEYLFFTAVVYVLAKVYKQAIELKEETRLTI